MKRFSCFFLATGAFALMTGAAAAQAPADKYLNDAHAHKAMAAGYIGNPNHPMDANMANHCSQLAKLALANAERARKAGWVEQPAVAAPVLNVVGKTPSPSH